MPFMECLLLYTCTYCGKEHPELAEWRKGAHRIRVCGSVECEVKARKAGFRRAL